MSMEIFKHDLTSKALLHIDKAKFHYLKIGMFDPVCCLKAACLLLINGINFDSLTVVKGGNEFCYAMYSQVAVCLIVAC